MVITKSLKENLEKVRILIVGSVQKSLINFRGQLIKRLVRAGHTVITAANGDDAIISEKILALGAEYHSLHLQRTGTNPFSDIFTLFELIRFIRKCKPDLILAYTIKPVIYSGLAAFFIRKIRLFALITGLGHVFFDNKGLKDKVVFILVRLLYRISLLRYECAIFQNPDDRSFFIEKKIVRGTKSEVVSGSGVDLDSFAKVPLPQKPAFLLIGRLLREKGILEYFEAARIIKHRRPETSFRLVGDIDPNPSSIGKKEVEKYSAEGIIEYFGSLNDVRPALHECRFYVLPSYREGTPRTVLEAMATGRPVITTDVPGCRETIDISEKEIIGKMKIGRNGILVPAMDSATLAEAMDFLLNNNYRTETMAIEGRLYAERRFDVNKVNDNLLRILGIGC